MNINYIKLKIKNKIFIHNIIGKYIILKKSGKNYIGLCPFHKENKPSFFIKSEIQYYKCFGCGATGDIFSFLMQYKKKTFNEVINDLNMEYKISIPLILSKKDDIKVNKFNEVIKYVQEYFQSELFNKSNKIAIDYLINKRKLNKYTILKYGLGYGGKTKNLFFKFLNYHNILAKDVITLGLITKNKNSIHVPFLNRIIIPIKKNNNIIAFAGRIIKNEDYRSKYINSPNNFLYIKGETLYGYNTNEILLKKYSFSIIVEGYFDVIAANLAGFTALSPCGTSLTSLQIQKIHRKFNFVILCLDRDISGLKSHWDMLKNFFIHNVHVQIVNIAFQDPGNAIEFKKLGYLEKKYSNSFDILKYFMYEIKEKYIYNSIENRIKSIEFLLTFIEYIPNKINKNYYIKMVSYLFNESPSKVYNNIKRYNLYRNDNIKNKFFILMFMSIPHLFLNDKIFIKIINSCSGEIIFFFKILKNFFIFNKYSISKYDFKYILLNMDLKFNENIKNILSLINNKYIIEGKFINIIKIWNRYFK